MDIVLVTLQWWLASSLIGLLALPLALFTFRQLPDRGYAASRVLGLLVLSYVAWLVNYRADWPVSVAAGALVLVGLSAFFGHRLWSAHLRFLTSRWKYILAVELVFAVMLLMATHYKAATSAIAETEKPADFTMLHALMKSPRMPPHDPWLSGTPISYYYFGYFITGLLARLTGTVPGVAFNVGLALIGALTAMMAFALGDALTRKWRYGLLLAFAITLMGNMDYWFRAVHVYDYGDLREKYVMWPDNPTFAKGLGGALEYLFNPFSHNWEYWHTSRVVDATEKERLITEFPAFSFFLGDLHPHVMSLPFFLMTLALSLSLLKSPLPGWGAFGSRRPWQIAQVLLLGVVYGSLGFLNSWDFPVVMLVLAVSLALREMWAAGGLSVKWFLTFATVGLPIAFLSFASYLPFYRALQTQLQGIEVVKDRTDLYYLPVLFGGFLVVLVPALVLRARGGTSSKTSTAKATKGSGPEPAKSDSPAAVSKAKKMKAPKPARASEARAKAATSAEPRCVLCGTPPSGGAICATCGGEIADPRPPAEVPDARVRAVLSRLGGWLSGGVRPWGYVLIVTLSLVAVIDLAYSRRPEDLHRPELMSVLERPTYQLDDPAVTVFGLVLVLLAVAALGIKNETRELAFAHVLATFGFLLLVACEWFYFKDLFSMFPHLARMNTVFKFYIHVWVLLAAAAVPLLAWLLRAAWPKWKAPQRVAWGALAAMVALGGGLFPFLSYHQRVHMNPGAQLFLDGTEHFRTVLPDEARTVDWLLQQHPEPGYRTPPVILEAWHGSFTEAGRIATYTGFATVLGWEGHEEQWRGRPENVIRGGLDESDTVRRRYEDVTAMYSTPDLDQTRWLLRRYGVRYVFVGRFERTRFPGAPFEKWESLGKRVFAEGSAELYDVGAP